MLESPLTEFIAKANALIHEQAEAVDCVTAVAPLMLDLVKNASTFLKPQHYQSSPDHYTRNLIYDAPDANLSLYALVWLPGQWTPVHDHGSWGVVGVIEGVLEERSFVFDGKTDKHNDRQAESQSDNINLVRGGIILLTPGAVTSFVPNPDHIHITGVPNDRPRAVSLHLYGRAMSNFNVYDLSKGTRQQVRLSHNES